MKFRSPKFKRLHVIGAGRFVDGELTVTDPDAIARVLALPDEYEVQAVRDAEQPYDPADDNVDEVNAYLEVASEAERRRVLELEAAGKERIGILSGPHGAEA